MIRKYFRPRNKPAPGTQSTLEDPWIDSIPNPRSMQLDQHLLASAPSLAHEAIAQAGLPGAKVLGGASGMVRLHPVKVLLKDELKIKPASNRSLWEQTSNAVALMIWFHSPTFG